jgi:hypothetical protein
MPQVVQSKDFNLIKTPFKLLNTSMVSPWSWPPPPCEHLPIIHHCDEYIYFLVHNAPLTTVWNKCAK